MVDLRGEQYGHPRGEQRVSGQLSPFPEPVLFLAG